MQPLDPALRDALIDDACLRMACTREQVHTALFNQMFSSTACGFGGIAGQAFTEAPVTVVSCDEAACVYVGNRLAYRVQAANEAFREALAAHQMIEADRYEGQYDDMPFPEPASFEVRGSPRGVRRGPHALERAIDEAWMIARYGLRQGQPREAEVLVAGTDTVIARITPNGNDPVIHRLAELEPYTRAARFPTVKP